jgi:hypothetical protein
MNYNELASTARKEALSFEIKMLQPGEVLVGKLLSIGVVEFAKTKSTVNSYSFETDNGNVQVILGSGTDKQIHEKMEIGEVYEVLHKGKLNISEGRSVNVVEVRHLIIDKKK